MGEQRHQWAVVLLGIAAAFLTSTVVGTTLDGVLRLAGVVGVVVFGVLAVAVGLRKVSPDVGIGVALFYSTVLLLLRLADQPTGSEVEQVRLALHAFRGITLLSGAAFIALGPVRGLLVATITWGFGISILLVKGLPVREFTGGGRGVLGIAATTALAIVMFRLLASSAVQARAKAEVAQESAELAFLDELTGLPNRRQMTVRLRAAVARAVEGGGPDTVVMFDLDHFKVINDTRGHDVGDEVLQRTAGVVRNALRDGDVLCRWGGEEFVILLHDADEHEGAVIAERCRRALEAVPDAMVVTASFGVTVVDSVDTVTDVLRRVDLALYEAKSTGRNRVVVGRPGYSLPGGGVDGTEEEGGGSADGRAPR